MWEYKSRGGLTAREGWSPSPQFVTCRLFVRNENANNM